MMEYDNNVIQYGMTSPFDTESPETKTIDGALSKAKTEFSPLEKSGINSYFKRGKEPHRFSTLQDINQSISKAFHQNGLITRHQIIVLKKGDECQNALKTTIKHIESGEFISSIIGMENTDNPQATGSQITYYRRYNLLSLLDIEPDDEDDANLPSGRKGTEAQNIQNKKPSRTYEVFDVAGEVCKTFTDWGSFHKAIQPIDKYSHSDVWKTKQLQMLQDVSKWSQREKSKVDDKTAKNLDKLNDAVKKLITEIEK